MPEVYSSAWPCGPEEKIWEALRENHCEQVDESEVPGPVLRIIKSPQAWGKTSPDNRFFIVKSRLWDGHYMYMLLPKDTTKHMTMCSNSEWIFKRKPSWEAVKRMSPEEVEVRISEIISEYLNNKFKARCFVGGSLSLEGLRGIDIAIEVFNWTALEYEEALAHTAKWLWKMLASGEVRRLEDDHWISRNRHDLYLFVSGDTRGMNTYDGLYGRYDMAQRRYPSRRRNR